MAGDQVFELSPRFGDLGPVAEIEFGLLFNGPDLTVDERADPEMVVLHKLVKRFLLPFFRSVLAKEDGKISLPMPDTTLRPHPFAKKIVFYSRTSIGEKHFQFAIIQSFLKRLADKFPIFIHPESYWLKPPSITLRSQSPPHLCPLQRLSSWTLTLDLRPIYHQKLEATVFKRRPIPILLSQFFNTSGQCTLTRSLSLNPENLPKFWTMQ